MELCKVLETDEPTGPYAIRLPRKARVALSSRSFTLFLSNVMNWAEDGLRVVIKVMLNGDGRVSDYLRLTYPESFSEQLRKTQTDDTRRTLLFRLRYLFRCLAKLAPQYVEFRQGSFGDLKMTLDIFVECVRQSVGEKVGARLKASVTRFERLWETVNWELDDETAIRREMSILVDDLDAVFEILREAFRMREEELGARVCETNELERIRAAQEEANRLQRLGLKRCAALSTRSREVDDPYARSVGLERLNEAQREELVACFRYSHERFAVRRGDAGGAASLKRLAEKVWRQNAARFQALAKLKEGAGYKNILSLAAKLYKLAAKYPEADHFRWTS